MLRRFVKVWKFKYSSIDLIACLAKGLAHYDDAFGVAIVDSVLEDVRVGLEVRQNDKSSLLTDSTRR